MITYFASVFVEDNGNLPSVDPDNEIHNQLCDINVTRKDIINSLGLLKKVVFF